MSRAAFSWNNWTENWDGTPYGVHTTAGSGRVSPTEGDALVQGGIDVTYGLFYAGVWACKEAVFRSLGMKWKRGVDWRDVVIECASAIEPTVTVRGATAERMTARGVTRVLVSFSYSRMYATATAIAVRG